MGTFVLIVSSLFRVMTGGASADINSIAVPGFTSYEQCMSAGAMHSQKMLEGKVADKVIFTCNKQ